MLAMCREQNRQREGLVMDRIAIDNGWRG